MAFSPFASLGLSALSSMEAIIATLPAEGKHNARNYSGEKELTDLFIVTTKEGSTVEARCWMGRSRNSSVVYAAFWVYGHKTGFSASGRGTAGGGGYHKASAAIGEAIESAGITLNQSIHGVGGTAIRCALQAIVTALGETVCCEVQR